MPTVIKVNPEQLRGAANQIESFANDYQNLFIEFYTAADEMNATWPAADNVAYITKIKEFENDFKAMKSHMDDYVQFLRNSAQAYDTTQGNIIENARKLAGDA